MQIQEKMQIPQRKAQLNPDPTEPSCCDGTVLTTLLLWPSYTAYAPPDFFFFFFFACLSYLNIHIVKQTSILDKENPSKVC